MLTCAEAICSPCSLIAAVTSCNRPGRSRPFTSTTVWVFDAWLSITTRGGTWMARSRWPSTARPARRISLASRSRPDSACSTSTDRRARRCGESNTPPAASWIQNVSSAMPLVRVWMRASTIEAPATALKPT